MNNVLVVGTGPARSGIRFVRSSRTEDYVDAHALEKRIAALTNELGFTAASGALR